MSDDIGSDAKSMGWRSRMPNRGAALPTDGAAGTSTPSADRSRQRRQQYQIVRNNTKKGDATKSTYVQS